MATDTMRAPASLRRRPRRGLKSGESEIEITDVDHQDFSSFRMQGVHFASFFIAPVIMLGKTFTSLYKMLISVGTLGLSIFTTVWTLGQWKESIKIVETSALATLQHAGEAVWSVVNLVGMEVMFLLGALVHPNIPFLATKR